MRAFALILAAFVGYETAKIYLIRSVMLHDVAVQVVWIGLAAMLIVLYVAMIIWATRRRNHLGMLQYEKWQGKGTDSKGAPCAVTIDWGRFVDMGLLSVDVPWLVFRGHHCNFRLKASDLRNISRGGRLAFKNRTPFGQRQINVRLGGACASGWVRSKEALAMMAAEVEAWHRTSTEEPSIFPPLRLRITTIPRNIWLTIVPLALLALIGVAVVVDLFQHTILQLPQSTIGDYLEGTLLIYGAYAIVAAFWYWLWRMNERHNNRVEQLADANQDN